MQYKAQFATRYDWNDPAQQDAAIKDAVFKLRFMADRLEAARKDDIMTAFDDGYGLQGWWGENTKEGEE